MMLALLLVLLVPTFANASCSGSGLTWSCTAGSTAAQINTAISSASAEATITLAAGTYSTSVISLNNVPNGITLICASEGGCVFTAAADIFTMDFCSGAKTNLIRISGMKFTGVSGGTARVWLYCNSTVSKLRIDHNEFVIGQGEIGVLLGETSSSGAMYGVMDHNNCHATNNFMCMKNISGVTSWQTGQQGGANGFFFEDNICNFTNYPDTGTGCIDVWRENSTIFRFNTLTNSRMVNHSLCHDGPYNSEAYGNVISNAAFTAAPNYRNLHFQGSGEEIIWGNQVEDNGNAIEVQSFRSDSSTATSEGSCNSLADGTVSGSGADPANANDGNRSPTSTYRGYPTWHQPGRDGSGTLKPVYLWRNRTSGGTRVGINVSGSGFYPQHFAANRDYYDSVSASAQSNATTPFNGTTGTGYGTLANRPTTCTPTSEALDAGQGGVGYWATDQGTWKQTTPSQGVDVENGVLYRCSATNTWTAHYTPYTYPHPLVGYVASNPTSHAISGSVALSGGVVMQ